MEITKGRRRACQSVREERHFARRRAALLTRLSSTFKCEQLSASLLACLDTKHFLPVSKHARKTHCRKNHAADDAASGVLSETASEFEAEETSLLFPPSLRTLHKHGGAAGGGEDESVALTKWAGRVCATELNSSVKSDCTPSHGGRGSENEPLVAG